MKDSKKKKNTQIFILEEEQENPAAESFRRRFSPSPSVRRIVIMAAVLFAVYAAAVFFYYDFVHSPFTPGRYVSSVSQNFTDLWNLITGKSGGNAILFHIVSVAAAAVVGAALSVCGGVCQGIYHTPMASPSMLGIYSGGMLAAVIYLLIYGDAGEKTEFITNEEYTNYLDTLSFYDLYGRQIWMLIGCLAGSYLVIFISTRAGRDRMSSVILILAGVLFSAFSNAFVSLAQYYFTYVDPTTDRLYALMTISNGSFASVYKPAHLLMLGVPVLICLFLLIRCAPGLNVLMFGEEEAAAMGMKVSRFRNGVFLLCVIACSFILCFCGSIGFVGLITPHLARQMAGSDYRRMLPEAAVLGAIVMVLAYFAAMCTGLTSGINMVTSVAGGVLTLIFVLRYRRQRNADWA